MTRLKGVGPRVAQALERLGVATVDDLLLHFPRRYLDLSKRKSIAAVKEGETVTIIGTVVTTQSRRLRGSATMVVSTIKDEAGYLELVWFNQPYMADKLTPGSGLAVSGKVEWRHGRLRMTSPLYDILEEEGAQAVNTGAIIPLHRATRGLSTGQLRKLVHQAFDAAGSIPEFLPPEIIGLHSLLGRREALMNLHFPGSRELYRKARERMVYEELFLLETFVLDRREARKRLGRGVSYVVRRNEVDVFIASLPWRLTADQTAAVDAILADLDSASPMSRLLQGEVGSGKTIVAAAAIVAVASAGFQSALMAPTERLAQQHYDRLAPLLDGLGYRVALLLGGTVGGEKRNIHDGVAAGRIDVLIGTHALIQETVSFYRLGLVVIDEQHRFGVRQRLALKRKSESRPDVLVMSATPIPRTLAQTLYGDLDITDIVELPGGRSPGENVETVYLEEDQRGKAYDMVRREVALGRQAFIICPLVDESDSLQIRSVEREALFLKNDVFSDIEVAILHGRMDTATKHRVMAAFHAAEISVLIATTVVEVGIDVPNATIMIIEHAERFGLSQLHQLRGRVGRGRGEARCVLFADTRSEESRRRIEAMLGTGDGFALAEADLEIRGQGEIFGSKQSGLPDLRLADVRRHAAILEVARRDAAALLAGDPLLAEKRHAGLRSRLLPLVKAASDWLDG